MSHHPGPWYVDEAGVVAEGWGLIASLGAPEQYGDGADIEDLPAAVQEKIAAHATLIAAAPELLDALRQWEDDHRQVGKLQPVTAQMMRRAIERAEGRYP